jgi:flagellar hook-length control protein FliK
MPQASGGDAQSRAEVPAIAAAVTARALSGLRTFEIRLDPPELGRVEVHLTVGDDGRAEARLTADHPATLALLARDSQHLERALKDAGLQLSNNSLNFSLKGEGRQGDGGGGLMGRARSLPVATVAKSEAALVSAIGVRTAQGNARLDIRV